MKNPVQKMLKASSQMKNNPQLAQREAQSPNKINSFAAQMVIPEQQAMQNSKPIPYPVGSVLMQRLQQAQQAAMAAQQPNPKEGGLAQIAAKTGGVLKFASRGKVPKDPLSEDLITTEENSMRGLGERMEENRRERRNVRNQKADLGIGREPMEQKSLTSKERKANVALEKQSARMDRNAAAMDKAMAKVSKGIADETANKRAAQATERQNLRTMGKKLTEQAATPSSKTPRGQRPVGRAASPDYRPQGIEQAASNKLRAEAAEKTIGSGLQNPTERSASKPGKAPAYNISSHGGKSKPQAPEPQKRTAVDKEAALEQRKADRYKAAETAEKEGATPKKVSKEAAAYETERQAKATPAKTVEPEIAKGATAAEDAVEGATKKAGKATKGIEDLVDKKALRNQLLGYIKKYPAIGTLVSNVAGAAIAKNGNMSAEDLGREVFNALPEAAATQLFRNMPIVTAGMAAYPLYEATVPEDVQRAISRPGRAAFHGLVDAAGEAISGAFPAAHAAEAAPGANKDAWLEKVGTQQGPSIDELAARAQEVEAPPAAPPAAPAPAAPPAAQTMPARPAPAPTAAPQAAPAAPPVAAPAPAEGGLATTPPARDMYAGDTSEGTPEGAVAELMKLRGPGYQYSPEVMGMLKDEASSDRAATALSMLASMGAGLANRDRYAGAHDAALLANQAFTSGREREGQAQQRFLQGIIHNESMPYEQRQAAFDTYTKMQTAKAQNEALMARANLSGQYKLSAADIAAQARLLSGQGSGAETERKGLNDLLDSLTLLRNKAAEQAQDTSIYDRRIEETMAKLRGLVGISGDAELGQGAPTRRTLESFR